MKTLTIIFVFFVLPLTFWAQTEKYIPTDRVSPLREFYKVVYEIKNQSKLTDELEQQLMQLDLNAYEILRKDEEPVEIYLESIQQTLVLYPRVIADQNRDIIELSKLPKH